MKTTTKDFLNKKKVYVSVTVVNDMEMVGLNKKYSNKDSATDVLSFEIGEDQDGETYYLGDVVVNKDRALRQCEKYGNDLEHEISDLVAHGVLHLLGVNHKEEK